MKFFKIDTPNNINFTVLTYIFHENVHFWHESAGNDMIGILINSYLPIKFILRILYIINNDIDTYYV